MSFCSRGLQKCGGITLRHGHVLFLGGLTSLTGFFDYKPLLYNIFVVLSGYIYIYSVFFPTSGRSVIKKVIK